MLLKRLCGVFLIMIPIQQAFRDSKKQACYCTPSEEAKGWLLRFRTVRHGILNQSVIECHVSSVENPGWLFYIGDYTTQLYGDYNKPL